MISKQQKYLNNYIKTRYHSDEEFRKRVISHTLRYYQTPKGKIARLKAYEKMKASGYYTDYLIRKRKQAKKEGLCLRCFKRKAEKNRSQCKVCNLKKRQEYAARVK